MLFNWFTDCVIGSLLTVLLRGLKNDQGLWVIIFLVLFLGTALLDQSLYAKINP